MLKHTTAYRVGMYMWPELPSGQSKKGNNQCQDVHHSKVENKVRVHRKSGFPGSEELQAFLLCALYTGAAAMCSG